LHVITRKKLVEAAAQYSGLDGPLDIWYRIAKRARWANLDEVRKDFPATDGVDKFTMSDIKGNHFRLIAEINYASSRIFIRHVITHAKYSTGSCTL
jgi:mRNA interferase HigB